jgi:hypothetical protein
MAILEIPVQGETATFSAVLKDENDAVVPAASLSTLTLTFKDLVTGGVINSRNAQNVLNTNQHTLDANGNLAWSMLALDNPIIGTGLAPGDVETRVAEYSWTTISGKIGKTTLYIQVRKGLV